MAYIETALVSSAGKLLIQLDDGTIIDAGYVKGQKGDPGKDGADGQPGIPGAKGDPGTNGAQWHTGVGAPETSLGENGDLYMDVAAAVLPIYQKVNRDWLFLANLKVTPAGGGGGGTAAGGGGSVIIHPGPQPPITDNDNRPIQEGDLWVDINGNILYVYYDGVWSEVTACGTGTLDEKKFVKRSGDSMYGALKFKETEETDDLDSPFEISAVDTTRQRPEIRRTFRGETPTPLLTRQYTDITLKKDLYIGPADDTSSASIEIWAQTQQGSGDWNHWLDVSGYYGLSSSAYKSNGDYASTLFHDHRGFGFSVYGDSFFDENGSFYVDVFKGPNNPYNEIGFYTNNVIRLETDASDHVVEVHEDNGFTYNKLIDDTYNIKSVTNKEYVDARDGILQQEIVNLQGEIESITPTVQAGIWQDGNSATPGTGHFAMRLGNGDITQDYTNTTIVTLIVSTTDKAGGVHTFEKEEVGDEIQLFDVEDQHYGLFKIDAIDTADPNYVQFTVTHLRGSGSTHVDDDVIIRTFKPVTSGDGSAYLLKNGEYVDPPAAVTFEWTKNVEFVTQNSTVSIENNWVDITSKNIQLLGKGGGKIFLQSEGKIELEAQTTLKLYSKTSDITLFADQNELVYRDIQDTDPPEQIVNKQYVDKLFDFSQYTELS